MLVGHKAKAFVVENGEKVLVAEHEGTGRARSRSTQLLCAVGPRRQHRGLRAGGARHPARRKARTVETNEYLQTIYPNIYACGDVAGPVPVHAHRLAPGLVRGGQRAVRPLQEVPRRLLGDPVGDLHRSGGRARRAERDRGEGARTSPTRSRPTASTISTARSPTSEAHGMVKVLTVPGKDTHPRRHHRRRARRRPDRRVHRRDEARHRPEQDPRHDPHLPDARRGQQVRRRRVEARARA